MSNNVGYRISQGPIVSDTIRKQWKVYSTEQLVINVARSLITYNGKRADIGDGMIALRPDLNIGRLTSALFHAVYEPPFDSIEFYPEKCDIMDNGLYEIELSEWFHWIVWHYDIKIDDCDDIFMDKPVMVAEAYFADGRPLKLGITYKDYEKKGD